MLTSLLAAGCAGISHATDKIPYEPYTQADIEAKITCAVAISKAEFLAEKLGIFGTPRVCQGVKANELKKWDCISLHLDKDRNFAKATDACLSN